jgi:hypothetical protein
MGWTDSSDEETKKCTQKFGRETLEMLVLGRFMKRNGNNKTQNYTFLTTFF